MKDRMSKRLLSLLLTVALLVSSCPVAFAAEVDEATEPVVIVQETEAATEATEATETTEATEATEATEITETATTETTAETESTEVTQETEAAEMTAPSEEPAAEALPFGLKGLPEEYALSAESLAIKQKLIDHDVCAVTEGLTPGVDYVEGEVIVTAESQEQAELYAAAFNAELKSYSYGVAVLGLTDLTVPQAVAASADMRLPLPAVSPNHIIRLNPVKVDSADYQKAASVPTMQDWDSWDLSDPFLKNPSQPDNKGTYYSKVIGENKYYFSNGDASGFQYAHDMVDSYAAWGVSTGFEMVTVAVIDTGVNATHPDLAGKVNHSSNNDDNGHGTHVAGIIAATMDNGKGGAGIAPNVRILDIRVLGETGSGYTSTIIQGVNQAVASGADVINMSLGGYFYNADYENAIRNAIANGCCVVAAMGNDGSNTMCYPAGYPGVIAVGAADRSGSRAYFSNFGSWLDVSAPGYNILSTCRMNNGYEIMSGTSQATPVVSGVVALYKSVYFDATPAQIEALLKKTATKAGKDMGAGIVNAAKMLSEKPDAPGFFVSDSNGDPVFDSNDPVKGRIPCESTLQFYQWNMDKNGYILYTLDGTTPAVKDGNVVNGIEYDWKGIDLSAYAGTSLTVKAIQVNGLGMASSVMSTKITVQSTTDVTGVTITGPTKLIAGKAGEFQATVEPAGKASQSVTWSITSFSENMRKAKIDAKGKLTTPKLEAGQRGFVEIQATSKTNQDKKSVPFKVTVEPMVPVARMKLSPEKLSLFTAGTKKLSFSASDAKGNPLTPEVSWASSNPKVATVNSQGVVTAVAKGTANITCKALDGSGKSAKCAVTVIQPVESIEITGQRSIAPGASAATYQAAVLPSDAGNKAVEWSLAKGAPNGITVSAKGAVKVDASVALGTNFTLVATAKDGSGIVGQKAITVARQCTTLTVNANERTIGRAPGVTRNKSGVITTIGLFNVDLPNTTGNEKRIYLSADTGSATPEILWTSSNPAVVSVGQDNVGTYICAEKAGTATITVAAQDGSGKKATITVNVTIPASSIAIQGPTDRMNWAEPYLACGKSATNKAVFADTYGKPSNQKVIWSYTARIANGPDVTKAVEKWISVKNGKLSISSNMSSYVVNTVKTELLVTVTATATDGTGVSGSITYSVVKPATKMEAIDKTINASPYEAIAGFFACDQWFPYNNPSNCDFIITSSNPAVASVEFTGYAGTYKGMYAYGVKINTPGKTGTAKITIKTVDGSNKSCTFTVKVK